MLTLISIICSVMATYFIYKIIFYINRVYENKISKTTRRLILLSFFIVYYNMFCYIEFEALDHTEKSLGLYREVFNDISILGAFLFFIDVLKKIINKMEKH